jgi:hypothetical protein
MDNYSNNLDKSLQDEELALKTKFRNREISSAELYSKLLANRTAKSEYYNNVDDEKKRARQIARQKQKHLYGGLGVDDMDPTLVMTGAGRIDKLPFGAQARG